MINSIVVFDSDAYRARAMARVASSTWTFADEAVYDGRWRPAGDWAHSDARWLDDRFPILTPDLLLMHSSNLPDCRVAQVVAVTEVLYSGGGMIADSPEQIWIKRKVEAQSGMLSAGEMRQLLEWVEGGKKLALLPSFLAVASNPRTEILIIVAALCAGYFLSLSCEALSEDVSGAVALAREGVPEDYWRHASSRRASSNKWWAPLRRPSSYSITEGDGPAVFRLVKELKESPTNDPDPESIASAWDDARRELARLSMST